MAHTLTVTEAWDEIAHCSDLICRYVVQKHRWGCGTLEGCSEGYDCDVLDHMDELYRRLHRARVVVAGWQR